MLIMVSPCVMDSLTRRFAFDPGISLEPCRTLAFRLVTNDLAKGVSGTRVIQDAGVNALLVPAAVEVGTLIVRRASDHQVWLNGSGNN